MPDAMFLKSSLFFLIAVSAQIAWPPERIWKGGSIPASERGCSLNVVSWNIERGEKLQALSAALKQFSSPLVLLQECDMHARRTGNRNIAEHLARELGRNYLFAAEFEELGQRVGRQSAYHGQAILTALPVSSARILRFREQTSHWQPRWYLPNWAIFQRRTGGRIALAVELGNEAHRLVVYNVHLESRGGEDVRLSQMKDVLEDAGRYSGDTPIVLAGDLNTRRANSPVIGALLQAGFRKAVGNEITTSRGAALDWVFVRGPLDFANGVIHRDVQASDHFPLTVQIKFETPDCR
jgi:endonuclease/exonuclease/phosphatase family metal-dependent hydrolase